MNNVFDNVFVECFGDLKDNRYRNKQNKLLDVIALCICGILSGMSDFIEIYEFALAQKHGLKSICSFHMEYHRMIQWNV